MSSHFPGQSPALARSGAGRQCADAVLMVRPAAFAYNPQTAATNAFQSRPQCDGETSGLAARAEFDGLAAALAGRGVRVCVLEDTPLPRKPDAVFPNNWISFHADGTVVLYPLQAESRRRERRREAVEIVTERLGYRVSRLIDLTRHEAHGRYLEGTGSLVLDHRNRIAYACLSPRTDERVLDEWSIELGYRPVVLHAADRRGIPLYHTNVLMCIGERLAVIGLDAVAPADRDRVLAQLRDGGRELIRIGHLQLERFAGNMLELACRDESGGERRVLVLSETARHALQEEVFARLAACTDEVLVAPVPTIERLGGGGVRCMLAEVFLP
jgi:hypothetical protein